jgi:thioredoxin 1
MNKVTKIAIAIILIVAVVGVIILKNNEKTNSESKALGDPVENITAAKIQVAETEKNEESKVLPRLVDLGADKCIPCKMMAPILEELKKEYAEIFNVEFIDVWKNPDAGNKYGIRLIPTQIFFDTSGKELFRHEGFFGKDDILAKWKELGIELAQTK